MQRYQTGVQFAGSYVQQAYAQILGNIQITQAQNRPDISQYINQLNQQYGVEDVVDPATEQQYQVESGANYYWINNLETRAGANLGYNPDVAQFRQMMRVDQ